MPRRPRPASGGKPGKEISVDDAASSSKVQLPLPKATSKRKLKAMDSKSESEEELEDDDDDSSSDSDEEDDEGDGGGSVSLGDSEESDLDVDAPRVVQWVDEDDLEQPEIASSDVSRGKAVNTEDIVRVVHASPKFGLFIVYFVLHRKPSKTVRRSTMSFEDCPSS